MIDLHTHSTASDGFLNPKELLDLALKTKLEALALTDHDAVSGLEELHKFCKKHFEEYKEIVNCEIDDKLLMWSLMFST